jgi:hypothetical protein
VINIVKATVGAFVLTGMMSGACQAQELITNGDFSAGFTGWTTTNNAGLPPTFPPNTNTWSIVDVGAPNNNVADLSLNAPTPFGTGGASLSQGVTTSNQQLYRVQGQIRYTGGNSSGRYAIQFAGTTVQDSSSQQPLSPTDTGFIDIDFFATATGSLSTLIINVELYNGSTAAAGSWQLDNFSVQAVTPELNSKTGALPITLLAAACLLAYDRRRSLRIL